MPAFLAALLLVPQVPNDEHRAWLAGEAEARGIPGLSAAVVRDGAIALELGVGLAVLEPARAAEPATIYPLYSVSKVLAAVAVLQQVEAGKLVLDAPAAKFLADLPAELADVTLRQALGHTSGLRNWVDAPEWKELPPDERALLGGRDVLEIVAGMARAHPAGERFAYSQSGYVLAGLALEAVTARSYDALLSERLFVPLGMTSARFGDLDALDSGLASVIYERADGGPRPKAVHFEAFVHPAAGLNASVHDLALFAAALQRGELLAPASTAELWRETRGGGGERNAYGLGWVVDELDGHRRVGHEGGGAAWFWHFPDEGLAVIVLTNLNGGRGDALIDAFARRFL